MPNDAGIGVKLALDALKIAVGKGKEKSVEQEAKKNQAKEERGKAEKAVTTKALEARVRIIEKYLGIIEE